MASKNTALNAAFERIPLLKPFQPKDFKISQLAGFTNYNFHLKNGSHDWVLRIPKIETNRFINRAFEANNIDAVKQFGFAPEILWRDQSGLSLTANCAQARPFNFDDMRDQSILNTLLEKIARLHKSNIRFSGEINLTELVTQYFNLVPQSSASKLSPHYETIQQKLAYIAKIDSRRVPSHNDLVLENLLVQPDRRLWIIDWEYSAMTSPYWDLATLCNTAKFDTVQNQHLLELYSAQAFDLDAQILRDYQYILQLLTACWMATFSNQQLSIEMNWLDQIQT